MPTSALRDPARAPVLARDRPPLVVAPASSHLQVPRREAFQPEPGALREGDRAGIARLDVRLQPVESQASERFAEHELHRLRQIAPAGELGDRPIAEKGTLEFPADDLADVEEADDCVVLVPPREV